MVIPYFTAEKVLKTCYHSIRRPTVDDTEKTTDHIRVYIRTTWVVISRCGAKFGILRKREKCLWKQGSKYKLHNNSPVFDELGFNH